MRPDGPWQGTRSERYPRRPVGRWSYDRPATYLRSGYLWAGRMDGYPGQYCDLRGWSRPTGLHVPCTLFTTQPQYYDYLLAIHRHFCWLAGWLGWLTICASSHPSHCVGPCLVWQPSLSRPDARILVLVYIYTLVPGPPLALTTHRLHAKTFDAIPSFQPTRTNRQNEGDDTRHIQKTQQPCPSQRSEKGPQQDRQRQPTRNKCALWEKANRHHIQNKAANAVRFPMPILKSRPSIILCIYRMLGCSVSHPPMSLPPSSSESSRSTVPCPAALLGGAAAAATPVPVGDVTR